jgi:hypothetical protein
MTRHAADAKLLAALAEGRSLTDAAARADVSLATVKRRMADASFAAQVKGAQDATVDAALRTLAATSEAAALTLRDLLSRKTADSTRFSAASKILELTKARDVEQRIAAIEAVLNPPADDNSAPIPISINTAKGA